VEGPGPRENQRTGNGANGIEVQEEAPPTLEGNMCCGNPERGIVYFDNSGGVARSNDSLGNTLSGINVRDEAQPTLEENVCAQNGEDGIMYAGSTQP
jgi:parallel beta-helix repeat protein